VVAETVGERWEGRPPWACVLAVFVGGYVLLATAMIGAGLVLVHFVVPSTLGGWDESASRWLAEHRVAVLDHITAAGTFVANTVPVLAVTAVVSVVFLIRKSWREPVLLVMALTLEFSLFLMVNWLIDRDRPDVVRLDSTPATASYPSGHLAATIAVWGGVAIVITAHTRRPLVRVLAWVLAVGLAVLVGFARVYRGMHHVTDVVAGGALGVGSLLLALLAVRAASLVAREHHEAVVVP
jgi:membrane-associated phospholipid phosphatase